MEEQKKSEFDIVLLRQKAEKLLKDGSLKLNPNLSESDLLKLMHDLEVQQIELEMQAKEASLSSEEQNRTIILQTAMDGFWLVNLLGFLLEVNATYCQMSGYDTKELLGKHISAFEAVESVEDTVAHIQKITEKGEDRFETRHRRKDGSIFDVEISIQYQKSQGGRFVVFLHDITERKIAEKFREMSRVILQILNEPGDIADLIQEVLAVLKEGTGFDAVGIRLQEGDDYPFIAQKGFSENFILTENSLIQRNNENGICRDKSNNVCLECTCGLVILGKRNQMIPPLTSGGSWWTNDSLPLLEIPLCEDGRHNPRNRCIYLGYASIALVPIRANGRNIGLLQFNDSHKDRFTLMMVEKLEAIASHIGSALIRKQAEQALIQLNLDLENRVKERTAELLKSNVVLQQTEEKYRTVADYTYDWEYWINEEDNIHYMSPSVERITGYSVDEFLVNRQLLTQIVFPDDLALWLCHKEESHKPDPNKKNDDIEFRIISKTGEIRWIAHICIGIFIGGKYKGLRVSNRDITEKVKAENELLNVTVEVEERERDRFSLELHDDLGPLLSMIKLYFQWLSETDNPKKKIIIVEKGNISIDRAIQTTREIAHGLGSHILENSGYVGAMLLFTQSINETQKLIIDFNYNSNERFSYLLEIILYRITSELINNTLKYSCATHVEIGYKLNKEKNIINFTYSDDGKGFDLDDIVKKSKGTGLLNIQHRIKLVRGTVKIETGTFTATKKLIVSK